MATLKEQITKLAATQIKTRSGETYAELLKREVDRLYDCINARIDDVLQTSINSMGSARAEQEEYAKSIQYSIDTLKAAYQDFAQTVINSDFVKNLLGTAQSFLEVLTKIIDKFGTLPTILTGIAAIGGIKGVGKLTEYAYLRSVAK